MGTDQRLLLAFALALALTALLTPVAIWLARRTDFLDHPRGYKDHARATPYLGGMAIGVGIALPGITLGGAVVDYSTIALCAVALWLVGTVDDRVGLDPVARVIVEIAAAVVLWVSHLGWDLGGAPALDLAFTILWVVVIVNASNLMDNMDGAAATVGGISAAGFALIAVVGGNAELAALSLAVAGACAGFLCFNLASPARIFLGDGGSMPLGFLIAAVAMSVPVGGELGVFAVVALAPVAGLPILDTCLVVFSRRRQGVSLFSGGRDHLTHRLRRVLPSARMVALVLAGAQAALCGIALGMTHLSPGAVLAAALACAVAGTGAIWTLERPALAPEWSPAAEPELDASASEESGQAILLPTAPEQTQTT